ncbi:MAG: fatty acyl-AMP ligase [Caldilineaceae bacterium]
MQIRYVTLADAFQSAAEEAPAAKGYTFLDRSGASHLSFQTLWDEARGYAATCQARGIRQGDRVLLTLPTAPDFAQLYLALQLCGATPCVLPAPGGQEQGPAVQKLSAVARQIGARTLIAPDSDVPLLREQAITPTVWGVSDLPLGHIEAWRSVRQCADDLAVIQATSGSTGAPKCVPLTHRNVLANLAQIGERLQGNGRDVVVCWLPLYHDMGLIGCFLFVLYWQMQGVFFSPIRFLRDPGLWLAAISHYRGTLSPAPNFAFALTNKRISDATLATLELTSWKAAICGGEPIDPAGLQGFAQRFAACGFVAQALAPAYGMAEAALCVTMVGPDEALQVETISRQALATEGIARPLTDPASADATTICDCGAPVPGTQIRILDEAGQRLPDGQVGRIWVSGPAIMQGYVKLPKVNAQVLQDGWFDTGDLGYLREGRLFVTGRAKEVIIIRGHNYAPTDFEWAAEEVPEVTAGRAVAVGVADEATGTEQLVLLCEEPRNGKLKRAELARAIQLHVGRRTGILPAQVVLLPRNTIPRTTSGKLQRGLAKERLLQNIIVK